MKQIFLGNRNVQMSAIHKDGKIGILFKEVNYNTNPPVIDIDIDDTVIWFGDLQSLSSLNILTVVLISKFGKIVDL